MDGLEIQVKNLDSFISFTSWVHRLLVVMIPPFELSCTNKA